MKQILEGKPIELPDEIWKEIEERDRKSQQRRNEDFARKLAGKTPEERAEIEEEIRKERETEFAPETRTDEELEQEDERLMELLEKLRNEGQY